MELNTKVALVTGGAKGIGKAIVLKLSSLGYRVVINYNHSSQEANQLVEEIKAAGKEAACFQANVADFQQAENLITQTIDQFGQIDLLVNNAGITKDNLVIRMNESDFDQVIETNLKGTWNMSKHISKIFAKQRSGKIINITSVVGVIGNPGQTNYAASKAGIIGLTKSLAKELGKRGITCNAVAPGFIETQMTENLPEEMKKAYIENIPLSRLGEPEDVSNVVAFLASDYANYITGQVIHVDGGLVMH